MTTTNSAAPASILSKAAFARLKGWNRSTITRLAQSGKIVVTEDGKVDVQASLARLIETADPSKIGVSERHQQDREQRDLGLGTPDADKAPASSARIDQSDPSYLALQKSRAEAEAHRAALLKMDREEREGTLVAADEVRKAAAKAARAARMALMNVAARLGPVVAAQSDPAKCITLLETELRAVCEQLAGPTEN